MVNNTIDLSRYKKSLRELKITHREVAEYTGHSRENVTYWLNGKNPPTRTATHVSEKIDELITMHSSPNNKIKEKEEVALKQIKKIVNNLVKKYKS